MLHIKPVIVAQAAAAAVQLERLYQEIASAPSHAEGVAIFLAARDDLEELTPRRREAVYERITDILGELRGE